MKRLISNSLRKFNSKIAILFSWLIMLLFLFYCKSPTDLKDQEAVLEGLPKRGDVIMRTLNVTKTTPARMGTLDAAETFGANRLEWIYNMTEEFIYVANNAGILVGTTMNYNAQPEVQTIPDYLNKFTSRDLWGNPVTRYNFRKFEDWQTQHFSPDVNIPAWQEFYKDYLIDLYKLPVISIHRDDQVANAGLVVDGGSYTDASVEMFREYLTKQVHSEYLEKLGIKDPETFDIRNYFIELGAPGTQQESEHRKWFRWDGGPVLRLYAKAQRDAVAAFYRDVRSDVEAATGRRIPWSCNHTGQWGSINSVFDYALGEFYTHQMQIETMVEIARRAEQAGKVQALQGVLDGNWEHRDPEGIVEEMRLGIATAYALGMLHMVPWDMYMPGPAKRYYGRQKDFSDIFLWIRSNHSFFDGHETSQITVYDPVSSRHSWRYNQQVFRLSGLESSALRVNKEGVLGVVRSREDAGGLSRVVHLVDWNSDREEFEVTLDLQGLCGSTSARVLLYRPGHEPLLLGEGIATTYSIPSLDPWGMLVLEPLEIVNGNIASPLLILPTEPVVSKGSPLLFSSEHPIYVRVVSEESEEWLLYTTDMIIDRDCLLEAYAHDQESGVSSSVARWQFWVYEHSHLDTLPEGDWENLLPGFKGHLSENATVGVFPDGMPLRYDAQDLSESIGSIGDVELSSLLPVDAAFFRVGIAVSDDTEVLRPGFRVEFYADDKFLYETPIYNTVKGVVHAQEQGYQEVVLALPRGVTEIRMKLHRTGWFDEHNRVIWVKPSVMAGDHHLSGTMESMEGISADGKKPLPDKDKNLHEFEWTGNEQ